MLDRPVKSDFSTTASYREARAEWANELRKAVDNDDRLVGAIKTIELLAERVHDLELAVSRSDVVTLENGTEYTFHTVDHLALALAGIAASRGTKAPLPLSNGQVIPDVRMSEVVLIATQILEGGLQESEPQDDPT